MWAPILVNFFHIIFIILGFYGAYHFRIKYIITYLIWSFIWIGWNAFLICFYLNVGVLDRDSDLLNLGTGSVSWFEVNGYGCKPTYPVNITSDDPFRPIRPERVDDCLLDYTIVEVVESGVQCALALLGILGAILISYIFLDEDDRFDFVNGDAKSPQHTVVHPMYVSYSSIPTSASASATLLSNKHHNNHQALSNNNNHHQIHPQQQQLQLQQQLHHQQPNNFNSNTFLIHTNSISNNSHSHSHSRSHSHNHSQSNSRSRSRSNSQSGGIAGSGATRKGRGGGGGGGDGNSNSLSASKNSTLTRILYSPKSSNKIGSSTGNTIQPTDMLQRQQSLPQTHTTTMSQGAQHYYDDSTAKADQLYTNSNRRQFLNGTTYQQQQQQQQQHVGTPNSSSHDNTTSSLSYASLQNSNLNLTQSLRGVGGGPSVRHVNKKSKHRQSLYSIEFGPSIDTIRSRADTILDYDDHLHNRDDGGELSPKPMTPRRVKRRSVMARGTNSRQSTTSRRSHHSRERGDGGTHGSNSSGGGGTHPRNSTRSSRRKYQQNPVTKLLDQQQLQLQQQQHHHNHHHNSHGAPHGQAKQHLGSFHHKETPAPLTASNLQTLNQEIINNTNGSTTVVASADGGGGVLNNILIGGGGGGGGSLTKTNNNHYHSFRKNIPPDPIYYNTNAQTGLFQQTWQTNSQSPIVGDEPPPTPTLTPTLVGHFNPTYQHSTTNLNDVEHPDELYNNRPPSVRSSYSNFHGTRPLSSYLSNSGTTENVFAGLTGATQAQAGAQQQQAQQQQQQQPQHMPTLPPLPPHVAPATPPLYQTNPLQPNPHAAGQQHMPPLPSPNFPSTPPQNIPFGKRTASRESIRSMAFLNSGPPAYNLNYHTPPDSETTM
ncbi:uncharacterized protein DDB_G0283357 isoform X2 [Anastrepha obliqua]|uniref:uncharacterized protein DDB_G0283357 isoform X2 n=1 Tax=Anastrepha obliqua TaxID=95512 RepID=UPI0024094BC9|nr:uncharacterized protein DDB_G0283357 isoform X2 [Anastrepha obliqua]